MRHLQLFAVGLQRIVDPTAEQGRFHRSPPGLRPRCSPLPQGLALRRRTAFFHNLARRSISAEADGFLVTVESEIVKGVYGVLVVSFLSRRLLRRSQHRSRSENPSSLHLCIHTDGTFPGSCPFGGCPPLHYSNLPYSLHRLNNNAPLVPPNPNEFDMAYSIEALREWLGTKAMLPVPGSWFSRLMVGGRIWSRRASTVTPASRPPPPPSRSPVMDLV